MKTLLGLLFSMSILLAQGLDDPAFVASLTAPVAGGWTEVLDNSGVTENVCGNAEGNTWNSFQFASSNSGNLNSVMLYMRRVGAATAETFDVEVWTNNSGSPGSMIAGASETFNLSDLGTSLADYTITFSSPPTITASTLYHIVLHADQISATIYLRTAYNATGGSGWDVRQSTNSITWTALDFDGTVHATISGE